MEKIKRKKGKKKKVEKKKRQRRWKKWKKKVKRNERQKEKGRGTTRTSITKEGKKRIEKTFFSIYAGYLQEAPRPRPSD